MDYNQHLRKGFIEILKNILKEISELGFKEGEGLTITFSTNNQYVIISDKIKWPEEMKIYLSDGTFEDLIVKETFFEVVLYFDDKEELIKIPYVFVTKIEDLNKKFELNFMKNGENDFYVTNDNVINIDFEKK